MGAWLDGQSRRKQAECLHAGISPCTRKKGVSRLGQTRGRCCSYAAVWIAGAHFGGVEGESLQPKGSTQQPDNASKNKPGQNNYVIKYLYKRTCQQLKNE